MSEDPHGQEDAETAFADGEDIELETEGEDGGESDPRAAEAATGRDPDVAAETPGHVDEVAVREEALGPEEELEQLRDRHLRLAAEFDNYRRRTRREILEAGEAARADLARRLLEIVDDLLRVSDMPCDPEAHEALHQGVGLIARKLLKALGDVGMEIIDPAGERFDPNYHEALVVTATDDPEADETVSQVLLTGYRIGDRLLRPAQVAVFRYEPEAES